jgi:hypothetical protein
MLENYTEANAGDLDTGENHFIGFQFMERLDSKFYEVTTIVDGLDDNEDSPFVTKHIMLIGVLQTEKSKLMANDWL